MTVTAPQPPRVAALRPAIDPSQRTARIAGVLFVLVLDAGGAVKSIAAVPEIAWEASPVLSSTSSA